MKKDKYSSFAESRGKNYDQPYEGFPYYIRAIILEKEIWIDLEEISPSRFAEVADETIAKAFLTKGKNSIRNSLSSLLKPEENYHCNDPLDLSY